jgi:16S rRNA (guanine527-N7)-methyltransferase
MIFFDCGLVSASFYGGCKRYIAQCLAAKMTDVRWFLAIIFFFFVQMPLLSPIFPAGLQEFADTFLRLLDKWNRVHSLTSLEPGSRFEALLLDSAALIPLLESLPVGCLVADFGSGIGIPGIVIAAARTDLEVIAIDRNKKKVAFVRQAAMELNLRNLQTICGSAESIAPLMAHAGTAKAVGSLSLLLAWWGRNSISGAPFFAFKGPNWDSSEVKNGWNYKTHPYRMPTLGERAIIELRARKQSSERR